MKRWYPICGDIRRKGNKKNRHSHALKKEAQFSCCIEIGIDAAFIGQLSGDQDLNGLMGCTTLRPKKITEFGI